MVKLKGGLCYEYSTTHATCARMRPNTKKNKTKQTGYVLDRSENSPIASTDIIIIFFYYIHLPPPPNNEKTMMSAA